MCGSGADKDMMHLNNFVEDLVSGPPDLGKFVDQASRSCGFVLHGGVPPCVWCVIVGSPYSEQFAQRHFVPFWGCWLAF